MTRLLLAALALALLWGVRYNTAMGQQPTRSYDVIVYGGTAASVVAAIEADRQGMRVALVSPDTHLGGLTSHGLGWTDSKQGKAIGGLAREFYHRIWLHYSQPSAWTRVERDAYRKRVQAQPGRTVDDGRKLMWTFEPHVAEKVFDDWLKETKVDVFRDEWLDRGPGGVTVRDKRIQQFRTLSGKTFAGKMFLDTTYEGDLMAAAGVTYRIGRDAADEFGEMYNGIFFELEGKRNKDDKCAPISPYVVPGDPDSGFIAGIEGELPADEKAGDADKRLQSFNLRLCLTDDPTNRTPITRPDHYNPADYELLLRLYELGHECGFSTQEMPNRKTDSNNHGVMSLDFVGGSFNVKEGWIYSEASYEKRREIAAAHRSYTHGLLYTIMNNPRVPDADRKKWSRWGLAADEFVDNGNWPRQIYVREARRMVGEMMMTMHHVDHKEPIPDPVGQGSYSLDSHVVRRVVIDGKIRNEGGFYSWRDVPYPVSYRALVPKRDEIQNLFSPVTLSATHVAFGSLRMEPTYMILAHSSATAAAIAIRENVAVQDVPYATLSSTLKAQGQVLTYP